MNDRISADNSDAENRVASLTAALVSEIKRSREYGVYHGLKKKMLREEALFDRVNEYRKRCFLLQVKEYEDGDAQALKNLFREYSDVLSVELVNEYLTAEQRLCDMLRDVMESVTLCAGIDSWT